MGAFGSLNDESFTQGMQKLIDAAMISAENSNTAGRIRSKHQRLLDLQTAYLHGTQQGSPEMTRKQQQSEITLLEEQIAQLRTHGAYVGMNRVGNVAMTTVAAGTEYTTAAGVLTKERRKLVDKLFELHDVDCCGSLSFDEFLAFIKQYDPQVGEDGVREMFTKAAARDQEIDLFEFYEWVMGAFGSLNDESFTQGMQKLIDNAYALRRQLQIQSDEMKWNEWMTQDDMAWNGMDVTMQCSWNGMDVTKEKP